MFEWRMAVTGAYILFSILPISIASNHIPTIMAAAYGIIGMSIMPLFKHAMRNMQYVLPITRCFFSLVLVVTSESRWRLTHEGGNHAERKEELKKLKLDMGDARREVDSFVSVLTILVPGAACCHP